MIFFYQFCRTFRAFTVIRARVDRRFSFPQARKAVQCTVEILQVTLAKTVAG